MIHIPKTILSKRYEALAVSLQAGDSSYNDGAWASLL